jgi:phosphatidylinositol-3-phosphatase
VTNSNDDAGRGKAQAECCSDCGAPLAASQRYCVECGARNGPLPSVVASRVKALKERERSTRDESDGASAAPTDSEPAAEREDAKKSDPWGFMPSPQVAAIAVMALLAAGVILGSVTNPLAQGAGAASIILEELGGPASSEVEEPVAEAPEPVAEAPSFAATPEAPLEAPLEEEAPAAEAAPEPNPVPFDPEEGEEPLPEIKHVFLIVLEGHGYEEAFGKESSAPYFAETLAGEGKLLPNYYAVAQGGLANEIALLSGQGPTPQTVLNCPESTPVAPGALSVEGQVEGEGCVYPAATKTLPEQLTEAKLTWKAYVEPEPVAAWRKPFAYFAALGEDPEAARHEAGLEQLATDLKDPKDTPSFSYIVPNACHGGGETPCAPDQPAGLAASEAFLKTVVPEIAASPAYQSEGGLIAITFDQAAQTGPEPDTSSCCATPEYPNLPVPTSAEAPATGPVKPSGGGGQVGMLLISPYVAPGTVEEAAYYNHFSFLRSVEELFGLEPLGYAAEPALTGFDSTVYDASPEESTVAERPAARPLIEQDRDRRK